MLYANEMKLVSANAFGPISAMQKPDRTVVTGGWKAVGVLSQNGSNFIVLHRRRWFWMAGSRSAEYAAALGAGFLTTNEARGRPDAKA